MTVTLKIYDTRTREKRDFEPVEPGHIRLYVCGMTVQGPPHVGHLRAAVVADTIRRYCLDIGYQVTLIHNFTDVDDKIIERSQAEGIDYWEIANRNIKAYEMALEQLNILPPTVTPKASEHMQDIIDLISDLFEKGHAYATPGGDVYFEVGTYGGYGELSGRRVEELVAGSRIEVGEAKRNPEDFALWKAAKPGEPYWPSPWGEGRPGWHIECSAMAMRYCGPTLDMHGGGVDLIFPHHENEIAQSQASTGKTFSNFWIHHGMVNLSGEKMSKSTDHFFLASDVFAQIDPTVVRYYLLTTHFRSPIEFSEERLGEAKVALERLLGFIEEGLRGADGNGRDPEVAALLERGEQSFREAMEDDFNSAKALGQLFEMVREINRREADRGSQVPREAALKVRDLLALVGVRVEERQLEIPDHALELLEARNQARTSKDWAKADAYRDQLRALGFVIEDRPSGSVLKHA